MNIRRLDFFKKINQDVDTSSATGGIFTIIALLVPSSTDSLGWNLLVLERVPALQIGWLKKNDFDWLRFQRWSKNKHKHDFLQIPLFKYFRNLYKVWF